MHHLSLSLSRELWQEMLSNALPVRLAEGELALAERARHWVGQLGVRERVSGLLEDRQAPPSLVRVKDRAKEVWRNRRGDLVRQVNKLIRVEGEWHVALDEVGTQLRYGTQKVGADAYLKGVVHGTIYLLKENVEFPFVIERRFGASVSLTDIHYDPSQRAVIGSLADLGVHIGDHAALQLAARLAEYLLEQQLPKVNPVPILKREAVEGLVAPIGGPLNMALGVDDLELVIGADDMTLNVRFGFTQMQISEQKPLKSD